MKNIADFLSKFKIIRDPSENRKQVVLVIKDVTGLDIEEEEVRIVKNSLYLDVHPALKNHIFMRKKEILSCLAEKLPEAYITLLN
jgi:hypothetical protein